MRPLLAAIACLFLLGACAQSENTTAPTEEPEATVEAVETDTVDVELGEWSVITDPEGVKGDGELTFDLTNSGQHTHEFVIFETDLDPNELPTAKDGSVDEEGEGLEVVDEVEDIEAGKTAKLKVDLDPGSYALVCNIVETPEPEPEEEEGHAHEDDEEQHIHYELGMRTAFTVE